MDLEEANVNTELIFKTYENGYHDIEDEIEAISKSPEEIMEAIKAVVDKSPKFKEIMAIDKYQGKKRILIKGNIYNSMLKRVLFVYLTPFNANITQIRCITKDSQRSTPPGQARNLIKETLKELGMEEKAKEFSKGSHKKEAKSLGKGVIKETFSILKKIF